MRKLMMIAFTMFSLAGCLDEAPAPRGDKTSPGTWVPDLAEPAGADHIPGGELETPPHEVTRCVVSDDCVLEDPGTEYRMCDRESGTCIRNPLPF
jgi:hypothetical protein